MSAVSAGRRRGRIRPRRVARHAAWNVLGMLVGVIFLFPVYWMVTTALKPGVEIFSLTPHWWPHHPTLSNFRDAMNRPFFWDDVKNSVIITGTVVALSAVLALLAAVALAKYRFYGRRALIVVMIVVQRGPLVAGATLTALPVVVFFVLVQRRIAAGITAGAVRG